MKTVKSLADATRLAAQAGASLEVDGRVINAGAERAAASMPRPAPPPPPAPAPDPMAGIRDLMLTQAQLGAAQGDSFARVMAQVLEVMQSMRAQPGPPRLPVAFDIVRVDGQPTRIVPIYGDLH